MTHPFGSPPSGFGFGPVDRRTLHHHHRQARRDFRDQVREHSGHDAFGPGFRPGRGGDFFPGGFDPRGFGFGFGPGPRGGRRGGGRGRRGKRG
ncbi:MAG: PadR family transcriptional regulator, partial [Actinomycetota bacterium]|nr:PadR family transcriptional regulator [Actinomycetota bacterium]